EDVGAGGEREHAVVGEQRDGVVGDLGGRRVVLGGGHDVGDRGDVDGGVGEDPALGLLLEDPADGCVDAVLGDLAVGDGRHDAVVGDAQVRGHEHLVGAG